jgi:hypothetical protein
MRITVVTAALALFLPALASPGATLAPPELLGRLAGEWVLTGMIDGQPVIHDVKAEWVLEGGYLKLHELSREKEASGRPVYEAIVILSWEEINGEYKCLWLDTTANTGLDNPVIGRAQPAGHDIPFVFADEVSRFFNTFSYDAGEDSWRWVLNSERNGELVLFADVTLVRRKSI